jgi:Na+/H+ antiporter NhaD/arsenite permease-like protein
MDGGGEVIPAAAAAASEAAAVDGGPGPSRGGAESGADGSGAAITARASQFASRFPTTTLVLQRQPWKIIPFVASMFAFVEGFSSVGLIREISAAFAVSSNDLASVVFLFGFLSSLACNVLNNQPMTILFVTVIQSPFFDVSEAHRKAALFATVLGSNYGANLTPIGALAGVMWTQILRGYGHEISFSHFARVGFTVTPPVIAAACLALYLVLRAGA